MTVTNFSQLPHNDALALRRALLKMEAIPNLSISPLVKAIIDHATTDNLLLLCNAFGPAIAQQIFKIDPHVIPARPEVEVFIHASKLALLPPIEWLVRGEIPAHGLTVLFGPSGTGKSFLALEYALNLAQEMPIVYMTGEGQSGFPQRVQAWTKHHQKNEGQLYMYLNAVSLGIEEEFQAFINTIAPVAPRLVVVDTVARSMTGLDENSSRDMGIYIKACNQMMAQLNCATLLVHHTQKTGGQERGSSALRGASDSMIKLTQEDDIHRLECSKSKDSEPFETRFYRLLPVEVTLNDQTEKSAVIVPSDKVIRSVTDRLTPGQRKILEILALDTYRGGLEREELRHVAELTIGSIGRGLSTLLNAKFIQQADFRGAYTITDTGRTLVESGESQESEESQESPQLLEIQKNA